MTKLYLTIICIAFFAYPTGCKESTSSIRSEKATSGIEVKSNDIDETLTPFWPGSQKEYRIIKQRIVESQYNDLNSKKLLKYKNELVEITFDIQDVIEQFENSYKKYPNLKCDMIMAEKLRDDSSARSQFLYSEFTGEDSERLRYRIADLLVEGKFIITLRSNGNIVPEIIA